jgi:cell division protein FtsQ
MSKRGTIILDDPEREYAFSPERPSAPRRSSRTSSKLRVDYGEDFADTYDDTRREEGRPRQRGLKLKLRSGVPRSLAGRIATAMALLLIAGTGIALLMLTRSFLLHDERFMIQSPSSIEIQGNKHLTRAQLLDIFGDDVERNIFRISLADRQAELEQLPWVQHATIMRLLPNRIRISIAERTPVAFVRQGSHIGLVDANGVLLDMIPAGAPGQPDPRYSFPVVTGLSAADPASTRAARMKIFQRFTADLDSSGEKVSEALSEVDLSNPEDVKALIPENSSEILVHFGDDHFLDRYRAFQSHLPAWHTQYPNLASVDMRYEREVVLDMAGATAAKDDTAPPATKQASRNPLVKAIAPSKPIAVSVPATAVHPAIKVQVKTKAKPVAKSVPREHFLANKKPQQAHFVPPHAKAVVKPAAPVASHAAATSMPSTNTASTPSASAAARSGFLAKPSAGKPLLSAAPSYSPQVPSR